MTGKTRHFFTLYDFLVNKYGILNDEAKEICKTFLVFGLYPLLSSVQKIILEYANTYDRDFKRFYPRGFER